VRWRWSRRHDARRMAALFTEFRANSTHGGKRRAAKKCRGPALDDTYQSSVPRLYIVGETAGTASINLAMRSGRQAIEFIANLLKFEQPAVEPRFTTSRSWMRSGRHQRLDYPINKGLKYVALEKVDRDQHHPELSTRQNSFRPPRSTSRSTDRFSWRRYLEGIAACDLGEIIAQTGVKLERARRSELDRAGRRLVRVKSTANQTYKARFVVFAIGVRGSPRHLNLANERRSACSTI